jgi:LAO/AO transport system kinase
MVKKTKRALHVRDGVDKPPSLSSDAVEKFKKLRKKNLSPADYFTAIREGNRIVLSQAITLIESSLQEHQILAREIIEKCLPFTGKSVRIGITGVPGVGKSTFIESMGRLVTGRGNKLAVLAIDPSSSRSKGSILGDKTRMEELSADPNAFIRPSPSAGSLGGVARKTRESIILCESAGFDVIFIETVGVGQSEVAVHSMVDFFLLLMLAGAGDELQGMKRGIMEMADAIAITKADGTNKKLAQQAQREYQNALHLYPPAFSGWAPRVLTCSALTHEGIAEILDTILEYCDRTSENGYFQTKRQEQAKYWMYETIDERLKNDFYNHEKIRDILSRYEENVLKRNISPFSAANDLLDTYYQ